MPIVPIGNKVLCRAVDAEDHYPGSPIILTPDRIIKETEQQAEVVAVGPGARDEDGYLIPPDDRLKPGAWVVYEILRSTPAEKDGEFFVFESDLVAILDA